VIILGILLIGEKQHKKKGTRFFGEGEEGETNMKEQCWRCYWFKGEESDYCCIAWKSEFDCEADFTPIDGGLYKWITVNEGISPKWLEKQGKYYAWKKTVEDIWLERLREETQK
jgi:hypothetical protein